MTKEANFINLEVNRSVLKTRAIKKGAITFWGHLICVLLVVIVDMCIK